MTMKTLRILILTAIALTLGAGLQAQTVQAPRLGTINSTLPCQWTPAFTTLTSGQANQVMYLHCDAHGSLQVTPAITTVTFTALTAAGTTATLSLPEADTKHTTQVVVTGAPASCTVHLEGSLDGTNFFDLSGAQTCTTNVMFHVVDKSVLYIRANLTALSGGTSPSVSITYLGVH